MILYIFKYIYKPLKTIKFWEALRPTQLSSRLPYKARLTWQNEQTPAFFGGVRSRCFFFYLQCWLIKAALFGIYLLNKAISQQ